MLIERRSPDPLVRLSIFRVRALAVADGSLLMAVLTQLPVHGSYVDNLLGLLPMSLGMGPAFVPVTLLGTGGVAPTDAGLASGLFNTAQQVGGSLGLAILSTLAATQTTNLLKDGGVSVVAARVSGYHVAFAAAAIMLAGAAVLLAVGLRRGHINQVELELATSASPA